ncbi:helix-turn-helix transcriptional regulator [Salmonella enterica]|nr:helix-turn-helix transcriptional regulator [Salmonella enterica]
MLLHLEDRLKQAMNHKFMTIREFSEATNIPYPSLREYLSGKKRPGFDALASIVAATGVSADWLLTGEGSHFRADAPSTEPDDKLLTQIIEGVELLLVKMRKTIPAEKKARIIVMLYRSFSAQHQIDPTTIRQMIELVA